MLSNARGKWVKTEAGRIQFAPFKIARNFWRRSFQFANFLPPPIRDPWVLGSHISRSQENRGANYIGRICGRYPDMSASSSESRSCCSLLASLFPKAFVSKLHFRGHREQARPIQMID